MTVCDPISGDGSISALTGPPVKLPRGSLRRSTRRPSSTNRIGQTRKASLVQQRLLAAIHSGEKSISNLLHAPSQHASFRARGAGAGENSEMDRSVSRYRNDAAIVSFSDPPSSSTAASVAGFCYANNFMPGVHFFTFLAAKDGNSTAVPSTTAARDRPSPERHRATIISGENDDAEHQPMKVKKSLGLRMWIPDTVVYGETGRAIMLYTDDNGCVQRSSEVTDKIILERLAGPSGGDLDPVVVCKEPTTLPAKKADGGALAYQGNLLRLLSSSDLKTVLSNVSATGSTKSFALQKFVRCNGSKAFIVRAIHETGKPPYAWMISNTTPISTPTPTVSQVLRALGQDNNTSSTPSQCHGRPDTVLPLSSPPLSSLNGGETGPSDKDELLSDQGQASAIATATPLVSRVCTTVQTDKSCTFIKLSERGCTEVAELNKRLVKFIEHRLRLQLQTLVADFTKDADGRWWLLQVKHFRVRHPTNPTKSFYSLPRRLRTQYLGYRDSSIVEETACSDEEYEHERRVAQVAAQLTQRQVQKLTQCKSCLAAYPKAELSFKMTLKMISEMLVRIRSRLPLEKTYTFLTAALARESADPSLAYESWSVCSYCYAIYERDQQLQKVETKFADILGSPDVKVKLAGLGKLDDQADVIDPHAASTVLPAQLTLCRLLLVINGIYDIPPELYDAENDSAHASGYPARSRRTLEAISSHLYLRISALGYTECIPVDPTEICISHERAPRGARRRRSSALSSADGDDSEEDDAGGGRLPSSPNHQQQPRTRNYWLPIHLIRAVHFFAPRTPLHAKLKETSGLTPFLNEENSISIQFIRATEPPLQDPLPIPTELAERARTRRTALQPPPLGSTVAFKAELPKKTCASSAANHSVLLGATKLRMAQFRSAYVTKLDFYACMALTGEMFNIKGNLGLERIRYVDTKFLTSRYKLRAYNGVYIPDASYVPSDPLTSEWMDCLRVAAISVPSPTTSTRVGKASASARHQTSRDDAQSSITLNRGQRLRQAASTTSLSTANEDMDEELEYMIEHAGRDPPGEISTKPRMTTSDRSISPISPVSGKSSETDTAATKKDIPSEKPISSIDAQMKMLMTKPVLSPGVNTYELSLPLPLSSNQKPALWSLVVQLNHVHNLQSREQPYCRWECHYELFGQRRSAIERSSTARSPSPQNPELSTDFATEDPVPAKTEVLFTCTHRFFLTATKSRIASHLRSNPIVTLNLRNDVYSSTRSRSAGEFFCRLDLSSLMSCRSYDATLDVHASSNAPQLTPRESALVSRYPPYLSVSVQLSELLLDPDEVVSTGEFVVVGVTKDGVNVLKKIA